MDTAPARNLAEELLATLRQTFLSTSKHNPMKVLGLVEDRYPETETDCDMLRISLQMAKDMGTSRVMAMRAHHCNKIGQIIRAKSGGMELNS